MKNVLTKEDRVRNALEEIDRFADFGAVYHDMEGRASALMHGRAFCRLCSACVLHPKCAGFCRQAATSGAYQAFAVGDIHQSRCWLGLTFLVAPISVDGKSVAGAIEIGGILLPGELQNVQHQMLSTLSSIETKRNLALFVSSFQGLEEVPAVDLDNLKSFLRELMYSTGLLNHEVFESNNALWRQQKRLYEKALPLRRLSFEERRKRVLARIDDVLLATASGDSALVRESTDKILSLAISLAENGGEPDLKKLKALLLPAVSALSMDRLIRGEKWSKVMALHSNWIEEIGEWDDLKKLCGWFEKIVLRASDACGPVEKGNEDSLPERVVAYLQRHYSENVSLDSASKSLGASQSSVMHKLKEEKETTFSRILNGIRIKEAKRLLTFTSFSLSEISRRCGFNDQSYFTKVFSKHVNITPSEFRRMLKME
ncbi:MAG: helix-turn-helix domain-containing protein [Kiritimatiellaeota bacterium]|nr:helix-turn-helix domain-containing protein [Kiritimatiellota bacterium]